MERAQALRAARPSPRGLPTAETPLGMFLAYWLAHGDAATRLRPKTVRGYTDLIRLHIGPRLGSVPLSALHPALVDEAQRRWLQEDRLAPSTVRQLYAILQGALGQAVRWDVLVANPLDRVRRPALPARPPVTVWTPADVAVFWTVAETARLGSLFGVLLHTGLRISEALGLRWADVDWTAPGVRVAQQLLDKAGPQGERFGPVKTAHGSYRWVPLSDDSVTLLRRRRKEAVADAAACGPAYQDHGLVWQTRLGTPLGHRNVARSFDRLQAQAGVSRLRIHDLRHTHASLLIASGADPRLVAERLGHGSVAFTLQTYGHLWPGRQEAVLAHLPPLAGGPPPDRPS